MENTQEENARKGESMLTKFGAIKKIYVMPYVLSSDPYIDDDEDVLGVLISDNEESIERYTERQEIKYSDYCLDYDDIIEMSEYEARERYGNGRIDILRKEDGFVHELEDNHIYNETFMSIEELRERRGIESEPFDAEEIIRKIASEYVITPRRKEALIEIMNKLL